MTVQPVPPSPSPMPWTGVEHRHLASLAAIARTRSFRGAARELGYSQSALSQHIMQLERIVQARLAERRRGSGDVTLTRAGEAMLRHASPILAIYHAAQADLAALTTEGPGTLRLGVAEHLSGTPAATMVQRFLHRHPDVPVELEVHADSARLHAALALGDLDAVLGDPPDAVGPLHVRMLTPQPYVLVAPAAWGIIRGVDTAVQVLAHVPLVVNDHDDDAARVMRELRAAGIAPTPATAVGGLAALLAHVVAGTAAALVPQAAVATPDDRIVTRELGGLVAPRPVALLWHGERRHAPLVEAFVEAMRERHEHPAGSVVLDFSSTGERRAA